MWGRITHEMKLSCRQPTAIFALKCPERDVPLDFLLGPGRHFSRVGNSVEDHATCFGVFDFLTFHIGIG